MQKVEQGLWTAINHHHMLQAGGAVDTIARTDFTSNCSV